MTRCTLAALAGVTLGGACDAPPPPPPASLDVSMPEAAPRGDHWSLTLARFDLRPDGRLDREEWARFSLQDGGWARADADGSGDITVAELRTFLEQTAPVETVSLDQDADQRRAQAVQQRSEAVLRAADPYGADVRRAGAAERAGPPNILLVSMDTVRADRLGMYGHSQDTTPFLDAFAEDGVVFERAYSQSNESAWSHAALFTGRYASEVARPDYETYALPADATTLAGVLSVYGYQTAAFVAGGHVDESFGFANGFQAFSAQEGFASFWHTAPAAAAWIAGAAPEKPWFVFVHGYDAHRPYTVPGPFYHLFAEGSGTALAEGLVSSSRRSEQVFRGRLYPRLERTWFRHAGGSFVLSPSTYLLLEQLSQSPDAGVALLPEDVDHLQAHYDSTLAYADLQLAELLAHLSARGELENTLVVILSDHGEDLLDHDFVNHRTGLWETCVHTPLIIAGPGFPAGTRSDLLVEARDVMPTLLHAATALPPAGLRGRALQDVLRGAAPPLDGVMTEGVMGMLAWRTPHHKLILRNIDLTRPDHARDIARLPLTGGDLALYDLRVDPDEKQDLLRGPPAPSLDTLQLAGQLRADLVRAREGLTMGTYSLPQGDVPEDVRRAMQDAGYWNASEDAP